MRPRSTSLANHLCPLVLLGLTILLFGSPAEAQSIRTTDTASQQALARLRSGTEIRVSQNDGLLQGTLRRLTATQVVLAQEGTGQSLTLRGVDSLWVARRATGKGALVGALLGLGVGAIIGAAAAEEGYDTPPVAWVALYGGGGLLSGALLGAVVGSTKQWKRTYPTPGE
jgi:hypothetical protein